MDSSISERILDVANKVIAEKGLTHFTLDEVAKEAGISKGGLLYHYPSKDKLIKGLIENYISMFESKLAEREQSISKISVNNWLIPYINEQFDQTKFDSTSMYGLLAAVAVNHDLLQPVLEKRKQWLEKVNQSRDPIMAMIISFACDGIAFSNLLGLEAFPSDTKSKLMERLIYLSKECY